MTTSWACTTQGRLGDALAAHVGGTLLALSAIVVCGGSLVVAARGKWIARLPSEAMTVALVVAATGLLVAEWIVRLTMDYQ